MLGVEIHVNVEFVKVLEPPEDQENQSMVPISACKMHNVCVISQSVSGSHSAIGYWASSHGPYCHLRFALSLPQDLMHSTFFITWSS